MYVQHNLKRVINASGRMSILGVSNLADNTLEAMKKGAQHYYIMEELHEKAGEMAAKHVKTESAYIVNSASAGIALSVAAVITRGDKQKEQDLLKRNTAFPREILLMRGHDINYGAPVRTMIELGGGEITEIGYANGCTVEEIETAISPTTVGIVFVQSHHCVQKNMPSLDAVYKLAKTYDIPLILDAAAEEAIDSFHQLADMIILSGSKAIEGPTSGIIAGKKEWISYAKGHHYRIGRSMKIGKESIFGLLQALADYQTNRWTKEEQLRRLESLESLNELTGVKVMIAQDPAGREIYRARIYLEEKETNMSALQLVDQLKKGDIAIFTRDYQANNGYIEIDPRPLFPGDGDLIVQYIKNYLQSARK